MKLLHLFPLIIWLFVQIPPIPMPSQDVVSENASNLTALVQFDEFTQQVAFSPDGALIAVARQEQDADFTITIYETSTGNPTSYITGSMDIFSSMVWSPDSTRLAVTSTRLTGGFVELQSVRTYTIALGGDEQFYSFGNSDTFINNEIDHGVEMTTYPTLLDVAWSPDSTLLAVAFPNRLEIYAEDNMVFSSPLESLSRVTWSPDGRYLLTTSLDSAQMQLWGIP